MFLYVVKLGLNQPYPSYNMHLLRFLNCWEEFEWDVGAAPVVLFYPKVVNKGIESDTGHPRIPVNL